MINRDQDIEDYLFNRMTEDRRELFEKELMLNTDLASETDAHNAIVRGAHEAGLKELFGKEITRKKLNIKLRRLAWTVSVAATLFLVFFFRISLFPKADPGPGKSAATVPIPFINPPLKQADVPFAEYSISASEGDTVFTPSGSVLLFPPSAFANADGKIISGIVKIKYREFRDPLDFFLSGINMSYDSAGLKYNFQSSGMCELLAFQNSKPLFVNNLARPQINLSVTDNSPFSNLYFLDTVQRKWMFAGKDTITDVKNISLVASLNDDSGEQTRTPVKPLLPQKTSGNFPTLRIDIVPGSFEELFAYDKLKFEVLDSDAPVENDSKDEWENVALDRTQVAGQYTITFSNVRRRVVYKVRPVLDAADYDAALKIYEQKNQLYNTLLSGRVKRENNTSDSLARRKQIQDERTQAQNNRVRGLILARENRDADAAQSKEIIRSFAVNSFGVWNCDEPLLRESIPVYATFSDGSNADLRLSFAAIVYSDLNGLFQFPSPKNLRIVPGKRTLLWGVSNGAFYYFTYKDFKESGFSANATSFTFKMRRAPDPILSYGKLRALVNEM